MFSLNAHSTCLTKCPQEKEQVYRLCSNMIRVQYWTKHTEATITQRRLRRGGIKERTHLVVESGVGGVIIPERTIAFDIDLAAPPQPPQSFSLA